MCRRTTRPKYWGATPCRKTKLPQRSMIQTLVYNIRRIAGSGTEMSYNRATAASWSFLNCHRAIGRRNGSRGAVRTGGVHRLLVAGDLSNRPLARFKKKIALAMNRRCRLDWFQCVHASKADGSSDSHLRCFLWWIVGSRGQSSGELLDEIFGGIVREDMPKSPDGR